MDASLWTLLVAVIVLLTLRWMFSVGSGKQPPGPWGLPLLGYLPFLSRDTHLDFQRLGEKYGDIFSLRMGTRKVLVLNSFESTKEAFLKDSFMGRPPELPVDFSPATMRMGTFFKMPWREQRRYSLHMLRDLGLGKSKMEEKLQEEIEELLEHFKQHTNKPFFIRDLLAPSMSNNIGAMMFGKRFKYDDPVRKMLNEAVNAAGSMTEQVGWQLFFPWMRKLMLYFEIGKINEMDKATKELRSYSKKEIEEHEKTLNPDNIRDFIDGYLLEIKQRNNPEFCKDVLEDWVFLYFLAGSETVRLTVEWLLLRVASLPEARRRIQMEIDEVIGRNRLPLLPDQKYMPFTEAFILEMNRWRTILPLGFLRYTLSDTELSGYYIPKNTLVISNLWAVHHNKKYWGEDADEFRPERFLTEDGKEVKKWEHYIPFSNGKRACPGEPMAKVETFLYFVSILQSFDVQFPEGATPDYDGTLTAGLQPKAQDLILTVRD